MRYLSRSGLVSRRIYPVEPSYTDRNIAARTRRLPPVYRVRPTLLPTWAGVTNVA